MLAIIFVGIAVLMSFARPEITPYWYWRPERKNVKEYATWMFIFIAWILFADIFLVGTFSAASFATSVLFFDAWIYITNSKKWHKQNS